MWRRHSAALRDLRGRQHGPRYWLVPIGVLVISLLTALLVERLYESSHRQHDAAISLVQIEEEINEEQIGEYEAIVEGEVTPEIADHIAASRTDIKRSLDDLAELSSETEQVTRVRELIGVAVAAMDEELLLVEEGRIEEARDFDEEVVDPAFEELRDVLESADTGFEEYAARVDIVANVGGFGVAALAIPLTAWFVRRDRNQRVQQEALEESEERFRSLVQEGADLILILDTGGIVRYAAPSAARVLGRELREIVDRNVFELLTGDAVQRRGAKSRRCSGRRTARPPRSYAPAARMAPRSSWKLPSATC